MPVAAGFTGHSSDFSVLGVVTAGMGDTRAH